MSEDEQCGRWETTPQELKKRVRELEEEVHTERIRANEAQRKADAADVFVMPVTDGLPGEIDVCSGEDGHSHHFVPTSTFRDVRDALEMVLGAWTSQEVRDRARAVLNRCA
jgi:hypothetical protein